MVAGFMRNLRRTAARAKLEQKEKAGARIEKEISKRVAFQGFQRRPLSWIELSVASLSRNQGGGLNAKRESIVQLAHEPHKCRSDRRNAMQAWQ